MNVQLNLSQPESERRRFCFSAPSVRTSLQGLVQPNRVITAASLSQRIADGCLAHTLDRTLHAETGCSVLVVHLDLAETRICLNDWAQLAHRVNGEFGFADHLEALEEGVTSLNIQISGRNAEETHINSLVRHIQSHYHYLIF